MGLNVKKLLMVGIGKITKNMDTYLSSLLSVFRIVYENLLYWILLVSLLFCFTAYQPFSGYLMLN